MNFAAGALLFVVAFGAQGHAVGVPWKKGDPWPFPEPKVRGVVFKASATTSTEGFSYFYSIRNPPGNPKNLRLCGLAIDLRRDPGAHTFTFQDLTLQHDYVRHEIALDDTRLGQVYPLSKTSPPGWRPPETTRFWVDTRASTPTLGEWGWNADELDCESGGGLGPGESAAGFGLLAKEPPGIRGFRIPAVRVDEEDFLRTFNEDMYVYYMESEYSLEVFKGREVFGKTLAPVAAPEPFTVESWLKRLDADAAEARKLGWIKGDRQLKEIRRRLAALQALGAHEMDEAVADFARHVSAERAGGRLTDEADALLRLNALYLLERRQAR